MPSDHLIGRLVISFIACAPWYVSIAISQLFLIVDDMLIILGPLPILRLILVDK